MTALIFPSRGTSTDELSIPRPHNISKFSLNPFPVDRKRHPYLDDQPAAAQGGCVTQDSLLAVFVPDVHVTVVVIVQVIPHTRLTHLKSFPLEKVGQSTATVHSAFGQFYFYNWDHFSTTKGQRLNTLLTIYKKLIAKIPSTIHKKLIAKILLTIYKQIYC